GDFAAWCEREAAECRGAGRAPARQADSADEELAIAIRYGMEHERAHLERLRASHPDLVEIAAEGSDRAELSLAALRSGASVVYQAVLAANGWSGIADFLHRFDAASTLGA